MPQPVEMSSFWEVQETDKQKDISVFTPVKEALTLHLVLETKVENGKELEEEDDFMQSLLFKPIYW